MKRWLSLTWLLLAASALANVPKLPCFLLASGIGRPNTLTDARTFTTSGGYNYAGELTSLTYSDGTTPSAGAGYDRRGRVVHLAQGNAVNTLTYDDAGNLLTESYQGGPLDGLTVKTDYDGFLRPTNVSLLNTQAVVLASTAYSYDAASRLQRVSGGTNSATYGYVPLSPLVAQVAFKQNGSLRVTATRQYDSLNGVTNVSTVNAQSSVISAFGYGYNHANQRTSATLAEGSHWSYGHDTLGQLTSGKRYWSDGTPVAGQQFEYTFDDIGNRKSTATGGDAGGGSLRRADYTNNPLNWLTSRDVPGYLQVLGTANSNATVTLWSAAGPYQTPAGNFAQTLRHGEYFAGELVPNNATGAVWLVITNLAVRQQGTNADIATTNIGSAFVAQTPEVLGYDADGNLTNDGRWIFTWDAENRLTKIESRASAPTASKRRLEFTYDAEWRRIQKIVYTNNGSGYVAQYTNRFVYDGWKLLAVLDGGNNLLQSFVWGTDLSGSLHGVGGVGGLLAVTDYRSGTAGTYFAAYDGNGNVVALVRAADGSAAARYEYGPFGEFLRATGPMAKANPLRWSTKYQDDETGLVYYGWRYYSPSLGRWISRDPLGEAGGLNLYAAMRNDPADVIDSDGRDPFSHQGLPGYSQSERNALPNATLVLTAQYKAVEPVPQAYFSALGSPTPRPIPQQTEYVPTGVQVLTVEYCTDGDPFLLGMEFGMVPTWLIIGGAAGTAEGLAKWADVVNRNVSKSERDAALWQAGTTTLLLLLPVKCGCGAAKTTGAPRFLVTESGVAVPTEAAELRANMQLLQDASTSPAIARKFLGTDSQGPLRVRIEQAHPSTPGYTGPIDPLHTVDHLHIDRRLNGTTGPWQSNEKLPYGWPF